MTASDPAPQPIKPCPFTDALHHGPVFKPTIIMWMWGHTRGFGYFVSCPACECRGPLQPTEQMAAEAWGRAARHAPPQAAGREAAALRDATHEAAVRWVAGKDTDDELALRDAYNAALEAERAFFLLPAPPPPAEALAYVAAVLGDIPEWLRGLDIPADSIMERRINEAIARVRRLRAPEQRVWERAINAWPFRVCGGIAVNGVCAGCGSLLEGTSARCTQRVYSEPAPVAPDGGLMALIEKWTEPEVVTTDEQAGAVRARHACAADLRAAAREQGGKA